MKNAKKYAGIASILAIAFTVGSFSYNSPITTLGDIKKAAQLNDKDRLRDLIDFDSVKAGLKEDFKAQLMRNAVVPPSAPGVLGMALATAMVDPLIDTIVSPAGLTQFMDSGRIDRLIPPHDKLVGDSSVRQTSIEGGSTRDPIHIERGYDEFSRYRVRIWGSESNPAEALVLTLQREGLFSWKLTRISLPNNLLARADYGTAASAHEQPSVLSIESSDLRADPAHPGLFLLTTTLSNSGAIVLNYPYLEITLTDADDRVVVRRALAPAEYVKGVEAGSGIPANGKVLVKLFIDASATQQTGYRLYVFYPAQESTRISEQVDAQKLRILLQ